MSPKYFALWGGILMIVLGAVAFFLPGPVAGLPPLSMEYSYGAFLNVLPWNIMNKAALVIFGLLGVWCSMDSAVNLPRSLWYSRLVFAVMAVLMVLGLIPSTNTLFGYWPLFGADAAFHAVVGVIAGFYGFALSSRVHEDRTGTHLTRESLVH